MAVCSHLVPVSVFAAGVSTMSLSAVNTMLQVPYPASVFKKNHVIILLPSFTLDFITLDYIFFQTIHILWQKL